MLPRPGWHQEHFNYKATTLELQTTVFWILPTKHCQFGTDLRKYFISQNAFLTILDLLIKIKILLSKIN